MEAQEQPLSTEQEKKQSETQKKKGKPQKEKFNWWQSLLILLLTLVVSVSAAYFISSKYLWSNFDQNRLAQQLDYAQKQSDANPNDPKARVNLGYAYFLNGDNDNAIKQYQIALDIDKKDFDAYFNLGLVYNAENRYDDALKMAQKATDLSPRDYKGHLLKGMAYRKLKMYKEAIETLNLANRIMPGNTDIIFELGMVAEDQGDKKMAEDVYKEALSYDPMYKPAVEGLKRVSTTNKKN